MNRAQATPAQRAHAVVAAVPIWAWLTAITVVSVAVRTVISRRSPAPWIFDDELIYARLAESFANTGSFMVRGVHGLLGYGPGYPLLISPAYFMFGDAAHAYAAAKALNSLLMSLAVIPAYFIARRLLGQWLALVAAALAVVIPSLSYTSVIMTENAFYPATLLAVLAFIAALERPSVPRQVASFATIALAYSIRAQAIVFVPTLVMSIVAYCLLEARASPEGLRLRPVLHRLDAYRATWLVLAGSAVLLVGSQAARHKSPASLLGAYQGLVTSKYTVGTVARWVFYHLAELDLYLGVMPFAALVVVAVVALRRRTDSGLRAFVAVSVPMVLWLVLAASALSSQLESLDGVGRIEERNVFHVAPLFLIALLVWVDRGLVRHRALAAGAAAVAAALPGFLPFARFVNLSALSDTLAFIPLTRLELAGQIAADHIRTLVVVGSVAAGAIFAAVPRRTALVAPLLVVAYLVTWQTSLNRQIRGTSNGVLASSIGGRREWIDGKAGANAHVAALWTGAAAPLAITENEFFNRSLDHVYSVGNVPVLPPQLPEIPSTVQANTGVLLDSRKRPIDFRYVLADASTTVRGRPLQTDPLSGLTLYRTFGVIRLRELVSGKFGDGWSGPNVLYTRYDCRPGRLLVSVSRYPRLVSGPQTVVASLGARVVARVVLPASSGPRTLSVPVLPGRGGRCELVFRISPVAVPFDVLGVPDVRALGVHFNELRYQPGRRPLSANPRASRP